jgi:hypothetical protein
MISRNNYESIFEFAEVLELLERSSDSIVELQELAKGAVIVQYVHHLSRSQETRFSV